MILTHSGKSRLPGRSILLTLMLAAALVLPAGAQTPNCSALVPGAGGADDAATINNCLASPGFATLTANTSANPFKLYQPIVFPQGSGKRLTGAGNNDSGSVLQAQYGCGQASAFVAGGQYQIVIQALKTPNAVISNFKLDLRQLRKSCGNQGNYALRVGASTVDSAAGTQVTGVRIVGSHYGDPDYTTGWVHGGGMLIINSGNVVVNNNVVKDLGFTSAIGGQSAGYAGIQVANCANARVENNTITRVSFPLQIINGSPAQGYRGDGSGTVVRGNSLTGAAGINCPDCTAGRALKIQACGVGDELPLRNLSVTSNTASNWGGPTQAIVVPSGLDLICGVQYGTFTGNSFIGDGQASYGLEIRSSFQSPQSATHHNQFDNNTFRAGACSGCYDVFFEDDGPDQGRGASGTPSVGRKVKGTNIYSSTSYRVNRDCGQYAHAWWNYPPAQAFINRGQYLTVAAAGIRPDSSQTVTFTFKNAGGSTVLTRAFPGGNGNCVMNQQAVFIDPVYFSAPGLYKVYSTYSDGNSNAVIRDDAIGSIDVR
jgi:hypothetical protein